VNQPVHRPQHGKLFFDADLAWTGISSSAVAVTTVPQTTPVQPAQAQVRSMTVIEAVREALREEMQRDQRVVVLGEDVGPLGGVFRATDGLLAQFGPARVIDTPMMALGIAGLAV